MEPWHIHNNLTDCQRCCWDPTFIQGAAPLQRYPMDFVFGNLCLAQSSDVAGHVNGNVFYSFTPTHFWNNFSRYWITHHYYTVVSNRHRSTSDPTGGHLGLMYFQYLFNNSGTCLQGTLRHERTPSDQGMFSQKGVLYLHHVKQLLKEGSEEHLSSKDTCNEETPVIKGHLSWRDTCQKGTPVIKGHL